MNSSIIVAIIVAIIAPAVMALLTGRQLRQGKEADWKRQDAVADQAAVAAELLLERQDAVAHKADLVAVQAAEAAKLLLERQDAVADQAAVAAELLVVANERVAKSAEEQAGKLDQIHTLVNSNMTASMQGELDATVAQAVLLEEVIEMRREAGKEPSPETEAALVLTKKKVEELRAALDDRVKNTEKADAQLKEKEGS